jgi:lipoate-protein ligase A
MMNRLPLPVLSDSLLILNQLASPAAAAWQMACDEWLLKQSSRPVLRVYAWSQAAWSFGYFQKLEMVRRELGAFPGTLMRRWTGGGMVDHQADLPYSLILPSQHPWSRLPTAQSYQKIHSALAQALRQQGLDAKLATGAPSAGSQCFRSPVTADVMLEGHKIAGAAQRRSRHGTLHQGSIQLPDRTLDANALLLHLAETLEGEGTSNPYDLSTADTSAITTLAEQKYATAQWLGLR